MVLFSYPSAVSFWTLTDLITRTSFVVGALLYTLYSAFFSFSFRKLPLVVVMVSARVFHWVRLSYDPLWSCCKHLTSIPYTMLSANVDMFVFVCWYPTFQFTFSDGKRRNSCLTVMHYIHFEPFPVKTNHCQALTASPSSRLKVPSRWHLHVAIRKIRDVKAALQHGVSWIYKLPCNYKHKSSRGSSFHIAESWGRVWDCEGHITAVS